MLTVQTSTLPPSLPASTLNFRVSVSHTGVSSDGTALSTMTLPRAWLSLTGCSPLSSAVKSGASLPALISGPPSAIGLPLNITAPALSAMEHLRWMEFGLGDACRERSTVYRWGLSYHRQRLQWGSGCSGAAAAVGYGCSGA